MTDNLTKSVYQTLEQAQSIFEKKSKDYGTNWREYRIITVGDQLYIKAKRIGTISNGIQKVNGKGDDIGSEFLGILNYSIIGVIQNRLGDREPGEKSMSTAEVMLHYTDIIHKFKMYLSSQHSYLIEKIEGFTPKKLSGILERKALRIKGLHYANKKEGGKVIIFGALLDILLWATIAHSTYKAT
jgi:hypothetical protein